MEFFNWDPGCPASAGTLSEDIPILHEPRTLPSPRPQCEIGIITCLTQMLSLPGDTWLRLIVWMGAGLVVYFTYIAAAIVDYGLLTAEVKRYE